LLSAFFYLNNTAHANLTANSDTNWTIHFAFEYIEEQDYSSESLRKALLELKNANTRPALAAAIIISHYEEMSPTLTKGLIDQLSVKTEALRQLETENPVWVEFSGANFKDYFDPYDGSNETLANSLIVLQQIGREYNSLSFTIPCEYFYRHPDIGILTHFVGMHRHRNARSSFEISCHTDKSFTGAGPNYFAFRTAGLSITARPPECGSIYRDNAAGRRIASTQALFRPYESEKRIKYFAKDNPLSESLLDAPLYDWALMGRQNYKESIIIMSISNILQNERVLSRLMPSCARLTKEPIGVTLIQQTPS